MTVTAVCAHLLEECLEQAGPTSPELPRRLFRAQARFLREPWAMATGADLRIPETRGERPLLASVVGRYMDALLAAAGDDAEVRRRLYTVINMLDPLSAFFTPEMMGRVAVATVRRWAAPLPAPSPLPDAVHAV
jgi:hypothetical protein